MTKGEELSLCDCCALMLVNNDESGCRDYYGHTHKTCDVPAHTVIDGNEVESRHGFTCDGCGETMLAYAKEWPAIVLIPAKNPNVPVPSSNRKGV